jgi:hypothetical protein
VLAIGECGILRAQTTVHERTRRIHDSIAQ